MELFNSEQPHLPPLVKSFLLDKVADKLLKWSFQISAEPKSGWEGWDYTYLLGETGLSPFSRWEEGLRPKQDPAVRTPSCSRVGDVGGPWSPWCCPSGGTQAFSAVPSTDGICVFDIVSVVIF